MIYFHGNAEDVHLSFDQMKNIGDYLNVNMLAIEYPGYGIYNNNGSSNEKKIKQDAEYTYRWILQDTGIKEEDILVFGRSMGGGPACFLAGNFNPGALVLMSTYTSIRGCVGDNVGFLKFLVSERFENIDMIKKATCPTFILHGMADEVIAFRHGEELAAAAVGQPLVFETR